MKKFITQSVVFIGTSFILFLLLPTLIIQNTKRKIDYSLNENIKTLILSDSRLECAINDSKTNETFNYGKSADAYYYQYLKIIQLHKNNSNIEKLILGFSYDNLSTQQERFKDDSFITGKFSSYILMTDKSSYIDLLKQNRNASIFNIPKTLNKNLALNLKALREEKTPFKELNIGGFLSLDKSKLKKDIEFYSKKKKHTEVKTSAIQEKYFLKIYDYCKTNNIELILMSSPSHEKLIEFNKVYEDFSKEYVKKNMPEVKWLDFSKFKVDNSEFADLAHLNKKGAEKFTNYLIQQEIIK